MKPASKPVRSRTALKNADCPARAPADRADRSDQVLVEDGKAPFSFPLYYQTAQTESRFHSTM
ncbi:hypothetical protein PO124_10850 [Bacillus licheniformis]|nr:hypothetical protein [Bacillus licheniformis]